MIWTRFATSTRLADIAIANTQHTLCKGTIIRARTGMVMIVAPFSDDTRKAVVGTPGRRWSSRTIARGGFLTRPVLDQY